MAEREVEFEHRDLHWGNLLIERRDKKSPLDVAVNVNGVELRIASDGLIARMIDFNLSRLKTAGGVVHASTFADEELFAGQGDMQFDVYRRMRDLKNGDWRKFTPETNVCFLIVQFLMESRVLGLLDRVSD